MKKVLKIFGFIFLALFVLILGFIIYAFSVSAGTKLDTSKLFSTKNVITLYSEDGTELNSNFNSKIVVSKDEIPDHVKNAFVAIEDKRFYTHHGVDYKGLFRATVKNALSFSFKEGGSTITQQLIKNTHLNSGKTIKRKIKEISLAKKLEKIYSKDEILCAYLNTIYFGDSCFGIESASQYFFSKSTAELTINESAILASIIKSPRKYSPIKNIENCFERKNLVLKKMKEQNYISSRQYDEAVSQSVTTNINVDAKLNGYNYLVLRELDEILFPDQIYGKKLKVYTYFDKNLQENLSNNLSSYELDTEKGGIILSNDSKILAYKSSVGEIKRQIGSTIKPLLVYGPAIETDEFCELTPILDEKTSFNGYSPSNYLDKYYGYVSMKDSLSKSLNIPAIKILNSVGIKKSLSFLNKTAIKTTPDDENLAVALGATKYGATLKEITSSYSVFANKGRYHFARSISKIIDENGKTIYQDKNRNHQVFSEETAFIVNDMTKECVKTGTAKKLSFLPFDLYAKTGTVGTSSGNTDAYSISYNKEYIMGIWLGSKTNSIMDNSITGGSFPTSISKNIWENVYNSKLPPECFKSDKVKEISIDKISYDEDQKILIAGSNTPNRYVIKGYFKNSDLPNKKSEKFTHPIIDDVILSVNYNRISMQLCLKEYYDALIYKHINNKKILVFDSKNSIDKKFIDTDIYENNTYTYSIVPYYQFDNNIIYGEEKFLDKIKTPTNNVGDDWWNNEYA